MHWIFLLPLAWGILVVCKPEVHWRLQAWQYRDPEANYPSDTWFLMQRISGAVLIIISLVLWAQLGSLASSGSSTDQADVSEESSASSEPKPRSESHTLTATEEEAGRISGYTVNAENELTVYIRLGPCAFPHVSAWAEESEDTITLTVSAQTNQVYCKDEDTPSRLLRKEVKLSQPVGDREVVDNDGTTVYLCGKRC